MLFLKITTAINFSGEYLDGYVTDNQLYIKRLADLKNTQSLPLSKDEVLELIGELQQVYSTMNNVEKSINKVTKRSEIGNTVSDGKGVTGTNGSTEGRPPVDRNF